MNNINISTKVVRFHKTGNDSVLKIEEIPLTDPGENEIRIKVEAIGLNRAEIMFREGQYLQKPDFPARIGYEAAGIVDAIGSNVTDIKIGDRVNTIPSFSMSTYGVYGETAIVPSYAVATYPDRLSAEEGASIWMQYITAYGALIDLGNLSKDDVLLITAASSSVGLAAIEIGKHTEATVIATTRGSDKKQTLLATGADHVIVTDEEDIAETVMSITGKSGATIIFDPIGGPVLEQLGHAAAQHATIFEYGALSPSNTIFPLFPTIAKSLTVRGYTLFEIVQDATRLSRAKRYIYDGLQAGSLKPKIDSLFPFKDIAKAHRHMASNKQIGKIVVQV